MRDKGRELKLMLTHQLADRLAEVVASSGLRPSYHVHRALSEYLSAQPSPSEARMHDAIIEAVDVLMRALDQEV